MKTDCGLTVYYCLVRVCNYWPTKQASSSSCYAKAVFDNTPCSAKPVVEYGCIFCGK